MSGDQSPNIEHSWKAPLIRLNVFNDPVPVEKPALQAVLMALETREAMGALTAKWRELGHDVGFGIGAYIKPNSRAQRSICFGEYST